jgi:hypothetical protein
MICTLFISARIVPTRLIFFDLQNINNFIKDVFIFSGYADFK